MSKSDLTEISRQAADSRTPFAREDAKRTGILLGLLLYIIGRILESAAFPLAISVALTGGALGVVLLAFIAPRCFHPIERGLYAVTRRIAFAIGLVVLSLVWLPLSLAALVLKLTPGKGLDLRWRNVDAVGWGPVRQGSRLEAWFAGTRGRSRTVLDLLNTVHERLGWVGVVVLILLLLASLFILLAHSSVAPYLYAIF
jgi:hypothetical protein